MIHPRIRLGAGSLLSLALAAHGAATQAPPTVPSAASGHRIPSSQPGLSLFIHHAMPRVPRAGALPVLILHGATFPTDLAAGWRMNGKSWMDEWTDRGYEVWALDFLGYGRSDRYPELARPPQDGKVLGSLDDLVDQVARAVDHIQARSHVRQVLLVAHSAGTFVAGRYAERHPDRVARLALFGAPAPDDPTASRPGKPAQATAQPAWFPVSVKMQMDAFESKVKASGRLDARMFQTWGEAYLASDPFSDARGVHVPSGMNAAFSEMNRSGRLPYAPERVHCPTLVIVGEWDEVAPPSQAFRLFRDLGAPLKRLVVLSQGGHRLHLETSRHQLYREIEAFFAGGDE